MRPEHLTALLTIGICAVSGVSSQRPCDSQKCLIIHNCRCALNSSNPGHLVNRDDIPQFVNLVFQGKITPAIHDNLERIFDTERKNENGCVQKATLFVPGQGNAWPSVRKWYDKGFEIGAYSNSYTTQQDYWRHIKADIMLKEALEAKQSIRAKTSIPKKHVRGWRTPLLEFGGDAMMKGLRDADYKYDATLKVAMKHKIWPFTMDNGWPFPNCNQYTNACVKDAYRGFWEVPVVLQENTITGRTIATYAEVTNQLSEEIFTVMKDNFESYYRGDRSPFMLTFTTSYFTGDLAEVRVTALRKFLHHITNMKDVHTTTIWRMLEWVRSPVSAANMRDSCKEESEPSATTKGPTFDHRQLTRLQRFKYYYGTRAGATTSVPSKMAAILLPAVALLSQYL